MDGCSRERDREGKRERAREGESKREKKKREIVNASKQTDAAELKHANGIN